MLRGFAKTAAIGFVQKKVGISPAGTLPTILLTSGASMLLTRGRRPIGLAVAALGAFLLWREIEAEQDEISPAPLPPPASSDAFEATGSR
jgi:hypothetical protein